MAPSRGACTAIRPSARPALRYDRQNTVCFARTSYPRFHCHPAQCGTREVGLFRRSAATAISIDLPPNQAILDVDIVRPIESGNGLADLAVEPEHDERRPVGAFTLFVPMIRLRPGSVGWTQIAGSSGSSVTDSVRTAGWTSTGPVTFGAEMDAQTEVSIEPREAHASR